MATEKATWCPLGRLEGSFTAETALQGPSGSLVAGSLSIRWRYNEGESLSHITPNPKSGVSTFSNPSIYTQVNKVKIHFQDIVILYNLYTHVFYIKVLVQTSYLNLTYQFSWNSRLNTVN